MMVAATLGSKKTKRGEAAERTNARKNERADGRRTNRPTHRTNRRANQRANEHFDVECGATAKPRPLKQLIHLLNVLREWHTTSQREWRHSTMGGLSRMKP